MPYIQAQELEADKLGLIFMARAGYDPAEAISFWGRMAKAGGGKKPPEFLSTHPSDARRIAALQRLLPEAQKYDKPGGSKPVVYRKESLLRLEACLGNVPD